MMIIIHFICVALLTMLKVKNQHLRVNFYTSLLQDTASMDILQFVVSKVQTELEKKAWRFLAPDSWNNFQTDI